MELTQAEFDVYQRDFAQIDHCGTGFLQHPEVRALADKQLGRACSDGEFAAFLARVDLNQDGEIDLSEYVRMVVGGDWTLAPDTDCDDEPDWPEPGSAEPVNACPGCGQAPGTAKRRGCPHQQRCAGAMKECRAEDGQPRCGLVRWHSHPMEECADPEEMSFSTQYWCRRCAQSLGDSYAPCGCAGVQGTGNSNEST
eukprot:TRINITY_DN4653_c0_g1_i2.p2 TRINITY_DN4653_c0_g1~~TRINITY_DN4653_c0_g1_i2.p2  ORF type:complete len:197 (-),score=37.91 TRINITY_DN4653_c0_g1_i2:323-913(-)